ncbi:MAG: prolipoprotein diacylglyceryl transferase [bacterium]|nr:prolipoprotein diacylglyceryl transferase [bacterium]
MLPTLFRVGPWAVPTHEFFIGLGLIAAVLVFYIRARDRGELDDRVRWIALGALLGGGLFARAAAIWQFALTGNTVADVWLHGGRSVLGGLAGAYFGAEVTKRIVGYRSSTGELFAPAVALGMAIGRIGCFLTEQIGTTTTLPWGITLSPAVAANVPSCPQCLTGAALHPSFLYEILFHLIAFAALWVTRDTLGEGRSFKLYLLGYGLFRLVVEFVRGNPEMAFGLSGSQLFLLVTIPLLALALLRQEASTIQFTEATL